MARTIERAEAATMLARVQANALADAAYWLLAWHHQHLFRPTIDTLHPDPRDQTAGLALLIRHRDRLDAGEQKLLDALAEFRLNTDT